MNEEERTLYFGYGSNLDHNDWLAWCEEKGVDPSGVEEVGPCWLPDYRLKFHYRSQRRKGGAADVVPAGTGHAVPGVLFALSDQALGNMDRKEGHPHFYKRCDVEVLLPDGRSSRAMTYMLVPNRKQEYVAPTTHYESLIESGLKKRNLPIEDLKMAIENSETSYPVRHVFVYGTLMEGEFRSQTLTQHASNPPQLAEVNGTLYNLGDYPGMLPSKSGQVHGEIYELDDVFLGLQSLDRVEGFYGFVASGSLFKRTIVKAEIDGRHVWAWTYIYGEAIDASLKIPSGRWRTTES